jgi:hypothetical protein
MSFLTVKPVFSTLAVSLGEVTTTSETVLSNRGKVTGKVSTTYYFAVFSLKSPNKVFILTSDSNDVMVPKLSELVKLPSISLNGSDLAQDVPKTVLSTLADWFSKPLQELDNVSPYDLHQYGFINDESFYDVINRSLSSVLSANGVSLSQVDQGKILLALHQRKASSLGLSSDNTTLAEKVTRYLSSVKSSDNSAKQESEAQFKSIPNVVKVIAKDGDPVIRQDVKSDDPLTVEIPATEIQENEFTLDVPLTSQSFKSLRKIALMRGIIIPKNISKVNLISLIEDDMTKPDADKAN